MPKAKRGYSSKVPMYKIVNAILYKLKTGVQWRYLPTESLFDHHEYSWKSVYHHFRKWSRQGAWDHLWIRLLTRHKQKLDMSNVQLDGSHTPVKNGGIGVGYQGRKKCKTSNMLLLVDSNGTPLGCSTVMAGNHNDAYNLEDNADTLLSILEQADISYDGLFLNADAGFDTQNFRDYCEAKEIIANIDENKRNGNSHRDIIMDDLLYLNRFVIERTNAWLDAFKTLLVRFDTSDLHWRAWHFIAFALILIRI